MMMILMMMALQLCRAYMVYDRSKYNDDLVCAKVTWSIVTRHIGTNRSKRYHCQLANKQKKANLHITDIDCYIQQKL